MKFSPLALIFILIITFVIIIVCISIVWRALSHRYSLPCPSWLSFLVEMENPLTRVSHATTIVDQLGLTPGMHVVDIGCGSGRVSFVLAHKVGLSGMVVALDIQERMLEKVREKAHAAHITNIRTLLAGIGEGKLEKNQFDRAVLVTVLGEIPDRECALKEIFSALKPNGILSVTEIIFDPHFITRGTMRALAHATGFKEKKIFGSWYAYTLHLEKCS